MDWKCTCKDCQEKEQKEQKFLEHPFYKKVDELRENTKIKQILKGAAKYKGPFNPDEWTSEELVQHAFDENYDQSVYITGLYDRIQKLENEVDYWRLRALKNAKS